MSTTTEVVIVRKSVSFAELLHEHLTLPSPEESEDAATEDNNSDKMAESNPVMTASLPNMEQLSDLDKLSERLGKFKAPHCNTSSRLPKPEISPKPAHLVAQLAKHKVPGSPANSSSSNAAVEQKGKQEFVFQPSGLYYLILPRKKRIIILA